MQTNFYLSEKGENQLKKLRKIAAINDRKLSKASLIELAIEISVNTIEGLDEESFEQVNNLKIK